VAVIVTVETLESVKRTVAGALARSGLVGGVTVIFGRIVRSAVKRCAVSQYSAGSGIAVGTEPPAGMPPVSAAAGGGSPCARAWSAVRRSHSPRRKSRRTMW
jgi:hypothetical protein